MENGVLTDATRRTATAAQMLGQPFDILVFGSESGTGAHDAATVQGVRQVLAVSLEQGAQDVVEAQAPTVVALSETYDALLAPESSWGKRLMPRVAAKLDVMQLSGVTGIIAPDTFERPIYAGNAIATVQSLDRIKVMTVRPTAFRASVGGNDAPIVSVAGPNAVVRTRMLSRQRQQSTRPDLMSARIVVSGGRGVGSRERFELIESLADRLGAAVGASRAAVDAGFAEAQAQVGQTGKIVAPDVYVAVGISGAIQHLAGMKDSAAIFAINSDPDAPIFQVADVGLVADLNVAVPELVAGLLN